MVVMVKGNQYRWLDANSELLSQCFPNPSLHLDTTLQVLWPQPLCSHIRYYLKWIERGSKVNWLVLGSTGISNCSVITELYIPFYTTHYWKNFRTYSYPYKTLSLKQDCVTFAKGWLYCTQLLSTLSLHNMIVGRSNGPETGS